MSFFSIPNVSILYPHVSLPIIPAIYLSIYLSIYTGADGECEWSGSC